LLCIDFASVCHLHQWHSYTVSSKVMKIFSSQEPKSILSDLKSNINTLTHEMEERPVFRQIFKLKIGRQCIHNLTSSIFAGVNFNWYNYDPGSDRIRVGPTKSFHILTDKITISNFDNFIFLLKITQS